MPLPVTPIQAGPVTSYSCFPHPVAKSSLASADKRRNPFQEKDIRAFICSRAVENALDIESSSWYSFYHFMASWALSIQAHGVLIQWRMGWQTGSRRTMGCWECESTWGFELSPRLLSPQTNRSLPHFWSAPLDIHLSSQPTVYVTEVSVHERSTATNLYSSGCFCNMSNYCCTACKLSNSGMCHVHCSNAFSELHCTTIDQCQAQCFGILSPNVNSLKIVSHNMTWLELTMYTCHFEIWHHSYTLPFVPVD